MVRMRKFRYYGGAALLVVGMWGALYVADRASADQVDEATAAYNAAQVQLRTAQEQLAASKAAAAKAAAAAQATPVIPTPVTVAPVVVHTGSVFDFTPFLQALMQYLMVAMGLIFPAITTWVVYEFRRRTNVVAAQTDAAQAATARALAVHTAVGLIKNDIAAGTSLTVADVQNADPVLNRIHPTLNARILKAVYAVPRPPVTSAEADVMAFEILGALGHTLPLPATPVYVRQPAPPVSSNPLPVSGNQPQQFTATGPFNVTPPVASTG